MAAEDVERDADLPIAFRGYARETVDSLLAEIEKKYRALIAERDESRAELATATERLSELTAELEHHAGQEEAAADALGKAERLKESSLALSTERDEARAELAKATGRLSELTTKLEQQAGQERVAANALAKVERLEKSSRALSTERDEARAELAKATRRLSQVTAELEQHVGQERAVADALIEAERLKGAVEDDVRALRTEAEREAAEVRERAERETQELNAAAESDAEGIRREAELKAEAIVRDSVIVKAQLESELGELRALAEAQAKGLLDDAREKIGSIVQDLFEQIGGTSREPDPALDSEKTGS